jgi:hypothetical protein
MSEFIAYVKAHLIKDGTEEGRKGQLGACPFSHRVLLALEEKELPYQIEYINLDNKPEWYEFPSEADVAAALSHLLTFH